MEHQIKKKPQFCINPDFRLTSPHFRFSWLKADQTILRQEAMILSPERKAYQTSTQYVVGIAHKGESILGLWLVAPDCLLL